MWFDKRRQPVAENEHITPDMMVALDQPYTQFEELMALSDEDLVAISTLCPALEYDSVNCVPCRAAEIVLERVGHAPEILAPKEEAEEYIPMPKLDALMAEPPPFEARPVAEQFAEKVAELDLLVKQVLSGPPIPPPNVSLDDLAALVVAAEMWVKTINAQGLELGPTQAAVKTHVEMLIERLRR